MGALCRKAVELKEGCRVVHNPLNFCPTATYNTTVTAITNLYNPCSAEVP